MVMHDFLFFRTGKTYFKLRFCEILYVQAEKKYIIIVTADKSYMTLTSIGHIEEVLPKNLFCRIHRSYIVSLEHTNKFDSELVYIGDKKIPIAEQYKNVLKDSVIILNCEVKHLKLGEDDVDKLLKNVKP